MNIAICGSIIFYKEMIKIKNELEKLGHIVKMPYPNEIKTDNGDILPAQVYYKKQSQKAYESWLYNEKSQIIKNYFDIIKKFDAILITNYTKNNIENYIGTNTLIEMGVAFYLDKKIFLLNNIPEINAKEEIIAMKPIIINNDLKTIQ